MGKSTIDTIEFNLMVMSLGSAAQKTRAFEELNLYRQRANIDSHHRGPYQQEKKLFFTLQRAYSTPGEKLVTKTELGRLIYGPQTRDDKLYADRTLRFPLTEQTWLSLIYYISSSRTIVNKELALASLYDYGVSQEYTFDPLRPEDELIRILHFVFCKENQGFLTYSQLSQKLGLSHNAITTNLQNRGIFYDKTLMRMGKAIQNGITNQFDQDLAYYALGKYLALDREYQKRSSTSRGVWLTRLGYTSRSTRSLYNRSWNTLRESHIRALVIEQMGLDVLTGQPLNLRQSRLLTRHHFKYDKSSIELIELILLSRSSHSRISHARRQVSYGSPITHVGDSHQHQIWLQEAKDDLAQGRVPRHWTDPSHPWYGYVDSQAVGNFNSRKTLYNIWGYQSFLWGFLGVL